MMNLFRNFFSTLRHYRASSVLNIIGMAVAFAAFYIILVQVQWGFGYNQHIKDGDRIFLMTRPSPDKEGKQEIYFCRPFAEYILSSAAGVESYGTTTFNGDADEQTIYLKEGDKVRKFKVRIEKGNREAMGVFGFEAASGNLDDMSQPGTVSVSGEFAKKNSLKVGDYLSPSPTGEPAIAKIVAIWKNDFIKNSSLGNIDLIYSVADECANNWQEWSYPYFVKLKSAGDKETFEQSASEKLKEYLASQGASAEDVDASMKQLKVTLVPVQELYYRSDINAKYIVCKSGNHTTDVSLLAVAILIILIALINFVNFFFALVPSRVKSVNTYKVFGTSRTSLVLDFIMEAIGLAVLAFVLSAFIIIAFAKSSATEILSAPIDFATNTSVLLLTIAVALIGAVASSIYPALYITSFPPAVALKGSFSTTRSGRSLRNVLIGVQFTISLALIICASFIKLQHSYMMQFDMGFDKEQLISGEIPNDVAWWNSKNAAFEDKLRSNPDIVDVTWSDGQLVKEARMNWGIDYKGKQINFDVLPVAYNFLDVMGVDIVDGRNFTKADELADNGALIFTEETRKQYGISYDFKSHNFNAVQNTVGICKNFHCRPLQLGDTPFAFYVFGKNHSMRQQGLTHIYVRTAAGANPAKVMEFIKNTAVELCPDADPDRIALHPFDDELATKYMAEEKLSKQITAFTLVAIILALMGVFGLVLFETQHRKKEIAVRRVLGAEVKDVLKMFCKKYSVIVVICFAIAAPLSWMIINRYLSNFAYRTPIYWWVFVLALFIVLAVTVSIVIVRSWSTATSNPVEAIKAE